MAAVSPCVEILKPRRTRVIAVFCLIALASVSFLSYIWLYPAKKKNGPAGMNSSSGTDAVSGDPHLLLSEADHFYWLNNGPRAAPLYARAEQVFSERGDVHNEIHAKVGRLRSEAETMSFVELSQFLEQQLRKPVVEQDKGLRLWCLIAKGYTDIEIDYRAAKRDWLEAQGIARTLGEDQWVTRASGELGVIAFLEGNPGRAARLLGGALISTMNSGDTGGQIRFLELIGNGFEEVNRHSEGLRFFERAIKLADAEPDSGLPFMAYEGKAQALAALGKPDEAKRVLVDALGKARLEQKRGHQAQLSILLGRLAAQVGNRRQAIAYLEDAGQFATRVQFYRMEADAMFELARLYRDSGDLMTAEARSTQGLSASQHVGDRYYVPRNLTMLADLKASTGRAAEADALYKQAEDVIEGMLISVDEPYWNSSVAGSMSQTYLHHFELLNRTGRIPEAFKVLERVRGRTLLWALEDRKAIQEPESAQTAALESELAGLQLRLMQANDTSKRAQLLDQLVEYERRIGLSWTTGDPGGNRLPVRPSALKDVEQDLRSDEVLLEYVLDEPNSFCIAIARNGAHAYVLSGGRGELEQSVQKFRDEIHEKGSAAAPSKHLYDLLVAPIPEARSATRIVIAPDGVLNLLPFEALRDSQGQYLLTSYIISYAPSGTTLDVLRRTKGQQPPRPLLALGDVVYENQGGAGRKLPSPASMRGKIERGIADYSGMALHDLPQTRKEVEEIGKIVGPGSVLLLGKDATESAFKKEPLDQFQVLHLAVHGFADAQFPERSALVLGADPKSGDDGLLQVREIIRLRLNAELTTLSACDTGVGKLQGQEGISNLVEAFLVAGSRSVVASLWSADDTFASALMERFYQHLADGQDASSALRHAKLDLLKEYGDQMSPFYWAAFTAVGETSQPVGLRQQ
jgi:CHAT domain-containing protein